MKQFIISVLVLAIMVSCSKEDREETMRDGEIRVTAGIDGTKTRAIADATTGLTGARFLVKHGTSAPTTWSGATEYTGDVAAATGKVKFSTTPKYDTNNQNAYFVAYYPGTALTSNAVEWDIDGKTDIMVTNNVWSAGNYLAPASTGLTFHHRLARIEVILQAEAIAPLADVRKTWGNIEKIEFMNAPSKMKYNLATTPTVSTSTPVNFALRANYGGTAFTPMAIPEKTNTAVNAVAMLAPVTTTGTESFRLKVTATGTGGTPIVVEIPVSLNNTRSPMTAGHVHTVTLAFKGGEKKIEVTTSTVDDWTDGVDSDDSAEIP